MESLVLSVYILSPLLFEERVRVRGINELPPSCLSADR
jgi:hypothetical protein